MFVKLLDGEENKLIEKAIKKAGSERKLARAIGIPISSIYQYKNEMMNLPKKRFKKLIKFLAVPQSGITSKIKTILPKNWGRIKGGIASVKAKKKNGTWKANLAKMKRGSSIKLKGWHKKMKKENPEQYYNIQFAKFKLVGKYKLTTIRGEKVRNRLEKTIADLLTKLKIDYEYETLVKGDKGYYFPDFKIGSLIIECTMWKGKEKGYKLLRKVRDLEKNGFHMLVFVPEKLKRYYRVLDKYTITDLKMLEGKLREMPW